MENIFYEIVIEGHEPIIKSFILGLLEGSRKTGTVIVSSESNIKSEKLSEVLLEVTRIRESTCRLVIEEGLLELVKKGLVNSFDSLKMQLKEVKKIKKASFIFHYEVFTKEYGEEIKKIFKNLPAGLDISADYQPEEEIHPDAKGIEFFAPLHDYNLKAHGSVEGPIDVLLPFYKKIQDYELIKVDHIILHFEN